MSLGNILDGLMAFKIVRTLPCHQCLRHRLQFLLQILLQKVYLEPSSQIQLYFVGMECYQKLGSQYRFEKRFQLKVWICIETQKYLDAFISDFPRNYQTTGNGFIWGCWKLCFISVLHHKFYNMAGKSSRQFVRSILPTCYFT